MTDRFHGFFVALDRDIRDDDAEHLIKAVAMLRGVAAVTPSVVTPDSYVARVRARQELREKIMALFAECP